MTKLDAPRSVSRRLPAILAFRGEGRELSKSALWLFVALSLMNASNYLFHVIVSRELGPASYGALTSLLAVLLVLSVPLNVLQTTVAKRAAMLRSEGRADELPELSRAAVRVITPIALIGASVFVVGAPLLSAFLHVGAGPVAMLGGYAFLSLLLSVPLGVLQGSLRFKALAVVLAVGVGVRLVLGFALAHAGYGIGGALLATLLAPAISLVLAERVLRPRRAAIGDVRWSLTLLRGDLRLTLLGLGSFWVLAAIDILLARHFLRTTAAGYYASADILARALLFLPGAVSTAAFPRFVEIARRPAAARRWLTVTVGAVVGLSFAGLPFLVLLRHWAISLAFGGRFAPAAQFVPGLSIAMVFLAVANLLVYFHIAAGTRSHLVLFGGAAAEAGLIAIFHQSAGEVVGVVMAVSAAVTAMLAHAAIVSTRSAKAAAPLRSVPRRSGRVRVSLVLPCHNAGPGLTDVLEAALAELDAAGEHQVIVVSDGSTDETVRIANAFSDRGVQVIDYPDCAGKGHALRLGLSAASGDYVAFMDADGDISPAALQPFLTLMDLYQPDIILGSKRHPLSEIEYPPLRRVLSWTYHKLTRVLFRVNVRDTQTGMKLVRREVLLGVLPLMKEEGYAFDLEMLVVAKQLGFVRVFEAPIRINYRFTSQMNLRTPIRIMSQTLAIFYRRYLLNTYAQPATGSPASAPVADVIELPVSRVIPTHDEDGRLRVLFLNWRDIANPEAGGAEVFTHEVAKRWVARGHDVTLLTSRFRGSRPSEVVDGVRMIRMGNLRHGTYHLRVQRELARLSGYDAIVDEVNTLPMLTPLWQDDLPPTLGLIHQLAEDVWDAEVSRPIALVGRMIEPRLLRMYRDVTMATVSGSTMADLDRLGLRDVRVVLEGRDEPPSVAHLEKECAPTFAFVGRLAANKRPDHAIEAFRTIRSHLPDARLWMIGRGVLEEELRVGAPPGVEFLGRLPRDELFGRMARAHCLLVPSVREGWGLVITESNGVGTPAVGYDAPGIRDAIRPGRTGLLAPAGDARSLGERAVEMLSDPVRYEEMRAESRRWAGCFSWDATAEILMRLLRERLRPAPTAIGGEVDLDAGLAAVE